MVASQVAENQHEPVFAHLAFALDRARLLNVTVLR